jgi:type IV pilus assembly protein PilC
MGPILGLVSPFWSGSSLNQRSYQMAFLSTSSNVLTTPSASAKGTGRHAGHTPQALAKQKAVEKRAKGYKLKLQELAVFTQQLASMLEAGLPLITSLEALQEQTENPVFQVIIRDVRGEIAAGNSFSDAVKKFPNSFPALFISMVEAGEASGGLAEILGKVALYFESTVKLVKVNVLLIFVIPVFAEMFADFGAALPAPTQALIDLSDFLKGNFFYLAIATFILYKLWMRFIKTPKGRRVKDRLLFRLPVFGNLLLKISLSRFCRTYATLIRSGVPILRTLEIVASSSSKVQIEDACKDISKHISSGGQVSEILAVNSFFPPMMKHMVRAGESTGNVDGMMVKIADFYDTESETIIASLTSLIEPMLIVFLGVVVGGIVMAMFLPIFQLSSVAGGL